MMKAGLVVKPRKVFWDLDLAKTMRDYFFKLPEFLEQRGTQRYKYDTDYYNSEEATRLDMATGGALSRSENSAWELAYDGFNCFQTGSYTLGGIFVRCVVLHTCADLAQYRIAAYARWLPPETAVK
jgi:hypothetical protein